MKKIFLILIVVITSITAIAQTSTQINFSNLEKKIARSDQSIENPKSNLKYQTWISRGELMLEVYDAMTLSASAGLTINDFMLIIGRPKQQLEEEIDGIPITKMVMDRVTFTFIEGVLESWTFTNPLVDNPLFDAFNSFLKANELDDRGRGKEKIAENLVKLKYALIAEGSNCYSQKDYACSFNFFSKTIEIGLHPIVNSVDTVLFYYAGLSAQLGNMNEVAIEYYQKAIDYNSYSDGNTFYNIYEAYSSLGREDEGLKYLQEGFLKVPNNQNVLYSLINYYIVKDDDPIAVLEYLDKAKESDPENYSLYFAEGTLHDRLEKFELAEKAYLKAIELNPNYFDAVFNLGALYFNGGVKLAEEATKIPPREDRDGSKYEAKMKLADIEFKRSIPIMEKALEISPKNKATVETLKNLYFRFRTESDTMQKKYEEINELWLEIQ